MRLHLLRRAGAGAVLLALAAGSQAAAATTESLAPALVARDPGARIGALSIVGTAGHAVVQSPAGAPAFLIGLGAGERLVGGRGDDELGGFGAGSRVDGGAGDDDVYGGDDATLVASRGHDLLVAVGDRVTIILRSSGNEVIVRGHRARIVCRPGSRRNRIFAPRDARIRRACRRHGSTVRPIGQASHVRARAQAATTGVTGTGTDADPFVAPCWKAVGRGCYVRFPARTLRGLWANEYVPSYRCPADHPLLAAKVHFAPFGTTLPSGVDVEGLGPIGVAILKTIAVKVDIPGLKATGLAGQTATGHPNSSATNWTFGTRSYRVVLFCGGVGSFGYPAGAVIK